MSSLNVVVNQMISVDVCYFNYFSKMFAPAIHSGKKKKTLYNMLSLDCGLIHNMWFPTEEENHTLNIVLAGGCIPF